MRTTPAKRRIAAKPAIATQRRRRRRKPQSRGLAALGGFDIQSSLFAALGGIGAAFLNKVIPPDLDPKLVAGGKILLGAALPAIGGAKNAKFLSPIGNGMVAIGAYELARDLGVVSGIGQTDVKDDDILVVSLEGVEDADYEELAAEVLGVEVLGEADQEYEDDDINTVSDDMDVVSDDMDTISGMDDTY